MKCGLILIDHGSKRNAANTLLVYIKDRIQESRPDLVVSHAHMECANPTLEESVKACIEKGIAEITVFMYMLSPGRHATVDIPNMVKEIAKKYPHIKFKTKGPIGYTNKIRDIILEKAGL